MAGADGLFIAKEIGGDSIDLVALFELHARVLYDTALRMIAESADSMTLTHSMTDEAAELLYAAQEGRAPIDPLSQRFPGLNVADAYAIQQVSLSRRLGVGLTVVGHKIGLTSEPMQTLLGVDEPDFGYILDDMVLSNGAAVPAAWFCSPASNPRSPSCYASRCAGLGVAVDDVRAATEAVAVALEIVDSRIADWKLTLADTSQAMVRNLAQVQHASRLIAISRPISAHSCL